MAQKLKQTVVLRETAGSIPEAFVAGETLPDWAWEQVKDSKHLFVADDPDAAYGAKRLNRPAEQIPGRDYDSGAAVTPPVGSPILEDLDSTTDSGDDDKPPAEDEVPGRNGSKAAWKAFAEKAIADGYPVVLTDSMGRDDIVKACEEAEVIEAEDK